ncbi:hypothetical protein [Nocardia tengchongensis]|uniref:hypothetical protein n=1 Tax=Nocardia tengchongensis TaxID=2055889 RepID=UPI003677583C
MATIRQEVVIEAAPEYVWEVVRDVGAVHERLLPGRVLRTPTRSMIAKARFENYDRTLRRES